MFLNRVGELLPLYVIRERCLKILFQFIWAGDIHKMGFYSGSFCPNQCVLSACPDSASTCRKALNPYAFQWLLRFRIKDFALIVLGLHAEFVMSHPELITLYLVGLTKRVWEVPPPDAGTCSCQQSMSITYLIRHEIRWERKFVSVQDIERSQCYRAKWIR